MSNTKLTPVEWLEETIKQMIYNGAVFCDDEPVLMEHIKTAKEMEKKATKPTTTTYGNFPKWKDEWGNTDWRDTGEMGG